MYDIAIIGSGTAGLAAAIYAARASLKTVVLAGDAWGGQIATTNDVENFPGFDEGIDGPELTARMGKQAERFGAEIVWDYIEELDTPGPPFQLTGRLGKYSAKSVVVATGASPRTLGIPGEEKFWGRGVSTCATCDGAFFKDMPVALVGGGDSAIQEGIYLTRFASKIYVIHRRDQLRAGPYLAQKALEEDKFEFLWDSIAEEVVGNDTVEGVRVRNLKSGDTDTLAVDGFFIFIGHDPNTEIFKGKLDMNDSGYIFTDARMHTNIDGIFVAGEAQDDYFRQAITSAGEGTKAAMEAIKFVEGVT